MNRNEFIKMSALERHGYISKNFPLNKHGECRRRMVHSVGLNDAQYLVRANVFGAKESCPCYQQWSGMLNRCYSEKQQERQPTYKGVTVCEEWLTFSNFLMWWKENQIEGWQIDKDLLSDGKVYSPESCIFIPSWLNKFTLTSLGKRGEWPIGATYCKDRGLFQSGCNHPIKRKRESLGRFSTSEAATSAWSRRKLEIAYELKPLIDSVDTRIYSRVIQIISRAQ